MTEPQHHEYRCPTCGALMTVDIEPGKIVRVRHALPGCGESQLWMPLVHGARVEVEHVHFGPRSACEHVRVSHAAGDFCDLCGAELGAPS